MRVISQDGTMDFPYDSSWVSVYGGCVNGRIYVRMHLCGYDDSVDVADYSTKAKALKAMEMLRRAYENNMFYHCMATREGFVEAQSVFLSVEQFRKATAEYFQFPQDDEIEV